MSISDALHSYKSRVCVVSCCPVSRADSRQWQVPVCAPCGLRCSCWCSCTCASSPWPATCVGRRMPRSCTQASGPSPGQLCMHCRMSAPSSRQQSSTMSLVGWQTRRQGHWYGSCQVRCGDSSPDASDTKSESIIKSLKVLTGMSQADSTRVTCTAHFCRNQGQTLSQPCK